MQPPSFDDRRWQLSVARICALQLACAVEVWKQGDVITHDDHLSRDGAARLMGSLHRTMPPEQPLALAAMHVGQSSYGVRMAYVR